MSVILDCVFKSAHRNVYREYTIFLSPTSTSNLSDYCKLVIVWTSFKSGV